MAELVLSADNIVADHAMIVVRKLCQTIGAAEDDLGRKEGRLRRELPAETVVAQTRDHSDTVELIQLDLGFMVARVHQHHAVADAAVLGSLSVTQDDEGIVLMARHPSARRDRVYAVEERHALGLTLHAMSAVEVDHIPLAEGQLQTHGARLSQPDDLVARVDDLGGARDDIELLEHAVIQLDTDVSGLVDQGDDQGLGNLSAVIDGGQTGDRILAVQYLVLFIAELRTAAAVGARSADAGHAEIAYAEGGVLLRHGIQRIGAVLAHIVWVAGEAVIVDTERIGHIVLPELGTVIEVLQIAQLVDLHLISGILGF